MKVHYPHGSPRPPQAAQHPATGGAGSGEHCLALLPAGRGAGREQPEAVSPTVGLPEGSRGLRGGHLPGAANSQSAVHVGTPQELSPASTHVYLPPSHNTVCFEWCLTQSMSGHKQASLSSFVGWWGFCLLAPEGRIALNRLTHTQQRGSPSVGRTPQCQETPQHRGDTPALGRHPSIRQTPQCWADPPASGRPQRRADRPSRRQPPQPQPRRAPRSWPALSSFRHILLGGAVIPPGWKRAPPSCPWPAPGISGPPRTSEATANRSPRTSEQRKELGFQLPWGFRLFLSRVPAPRFLGGDGSQPPSRARGSAT